MDQLDAALPTADLGAAFETVGRAPDASAVRCVLDRAGLRVGDATLEFDDRLRAVLAWTPARPHRVPPEPMTLLLELQSVTSPTQREALAVCCFAEELSEFADVSLFERQRGAAVGLDANSFRQLLARVRALLEASGNIAWQPRGELALVKPAVPDARPPAVAAARVAESLDLCVRTSDATLYVTPTKQAPPPSAWRSSLYLITFFFVVWFLASAVTGASTLALALLGGAAVVPLVAIHRWNRRLALRAPSLQIDDDSLRLPTGRVALRTDVDRIVATERGFAALDRSGVPNQFGFPWRPIAPWLQVIEAAWQLEPVSAADVTNPPAWFARIEAAGVSLERLRWASAAVWLGDVGISPQGVWTPDTPRWTRCHLVKRVEGALHWDRPESIGALDHAPLMVPVVNEVASPLRTSLFRQLQTAYWRGSSSDGRATIRDDHGTQVILTPDACTLEGRRVPFGEIDSVEIGGDPREVVLEAGASSTTVRCHEQAAADQLRDLLRVWLDPTRPSPL